MALRNLLVRLSADQADFDKNLATAKASATRFAKDLTREITAAYYGSKEEAKIQNAIAAGLEKDVIDKLREQLNLRNALLARQREMTALGANIAERWAAVDAAKQEGAARIQVENIARRQVELERLRENISRRLVASVEMEAARRAAAAVPLPLHEQIGAASGNILVAERASRGILESFNGLSRVLIRGGGVAIGLTLLLNMIERMGQNIREARKEFEQFGDSVDTTTLGVLKSLPLIGQLVRAAQGAEGAEEAIAFADELSRKRKDMEAASKSARDDERRHQEEMLHLENERLNAQASAHREALAASGRLEDFTAAMRDKLDRTVSADDPAALARIQYHATKDAIHKAYLDALNDVRSLDIDQGFAARRIEEIQANFDEAMRILEEQYNADISRIKSPEAEKIATAKNAAEPGYRGVGAALYGTQDVFSAIARAQAPQTKSLDKIATNTGQLVTQGRNAPVIRKVGP